jgi:phosphotransferase system enzyme I (PtsI)
MGRIVQRRDLGDLLDRPPPPDAIVCIPALAAQAAVALAELGIRGVCTEHGGPLGHAALMVRELGCSALIGCRGCTTLPEGTKVSLDTTRARLRPG